ncbi:MAG: hypothetical protein WAO12_10100 [Venatoribacter sp.]
MLTGSENDQIKVMLKLVKEEVFNALDQATACLDSYASFADEEVLDAFLQEIQQLRGTFRMLDFRAGETLCEEATEVSAIVRQSGLSEPILTALTQAIMQLKHYLHFVSDDIVVVPSLLVPAINILRKERQAKPLPESFFFLANLRVKYEQPQPATSENIPISRARQLYQLGLLGLIKGEARGGAISVMQRSVHHFEILSRQEKTWFLWHLTQGVLDALSQEQFEVTSTRIFALSYMDKLLRRIQLNPTLANAEDAPDWLVKEFVYLIALAEPNTPLLQKLQRLYLVENLINESELVKTRKLMHGPNQSVLNSLSIALIEEIQLIKDHFIGMEHGAITVESLENLSDALVRLADSLVVTGLEKTALKTRKLLEHFQFATGNPKLIKENLSNSAYEIIGIEQDVRALAEGNLEKAVLVDPLSLKEARIALVFESLAVLDSIKRATDLYNSSGFDASHMQDVDQRLIELGAALLFLEQNRLPQLIGVMAHFVRTHILSNQPIANEKFEAFADAISAIEFYLESLNGKTQGSKNALDLVVESIEILQG